PDGGRNKTNTCPAGFSFYDSHEYTDYTLVNELYNNGFEIALHSITHLTNQTYWAAGTYETMVQEFAEQRVQMAHFANIPFEAMKGVRLPFLQLSGDASFEMMAAHNLEYDSSWPTTSFTNP
ncbi:hypothetical protein, partial [Enterobacter hormaechei]|uniref:hypothetical protein n=1 Tax=Enterobacter hormaechei TaxID=158836 RepID=UPI001980BE1A